MTCARCAGENAIGNRFCEQCGGPLLPVDTPQPDSASDAVPPVAETAAAAPPAPPEAASPPRLPMPYGDRSVVPADDTPTELLAPVAAPAAPVPPPPLRAAATADADPPVAGATRARRRTVAVAAGAAVVLAAVATVALVDADTFGFADASRATDGAPAASPSATGGDGVTASPSQPSDAVATTQPTDGAPTAGPTTSASAGGPGEDAGGAFPVTVLSALGSCMATPATDGVGKPVNYEPANAIDGDPRTAWRCNGSAQSQYLTFILSRDRTFPVTEVGIIPGYAKIDPYTGADRFRENHTVTRVRWEFDNGREWTQFEQVIDDPEPEMTWFRLPAPVEAHAGRVVITRSGNPRAFRDFTAVSEIALRGPSPERR